MNLSGILRNVIAPILAVIKSCTAWLRHKGTGFGGGFHVRRDGRVIYHGRLGVERFSKRGWGGRYRMQRLGPPKLTGVRLLRVSKSCCPANLLIPGGYQTNACICSQHA